MDVQLPIAAEPHQNGRWLISRGFPCMVSVPDKPADGPDKPAGARHKLGDSFQVRVLTSEENGEPW